MKMFLSKKCQADVMLIVQTPHKTFMIKYYDNNLKGEKNSNRLLQILFQIQINEKKKVSYTKPDNILNSFNYVVIH